MYVHRRREKKMIVSSKSTSRCVSRFCLFLVIKQDEKLFTISKRKRKRRTWYTINESKNKTKDMFLFRIESATGLFVCLDRLSL